MSSLHALSREFFRNRRMRCREGYHYYIHGSFPSFVYDVDVVCRYVFASEDLIVAAFRRVSFVAFS